MIRIYLIAAVTSILGGPIFTYSHLPVQSPQPRETATKTAQRQPIKAKKVIVKELPRELEGIVLEKGVFKLQSGYKFMPQPNNAVAVALQAGGRGINGTFTCSCSKQGGNCSVETFGGHITCKKSDTNPCSADCILGVTVGVNRTKLAIF